MALMEKYRDTLDLAGKVVEADLDVHEEGGKLHINGTVAYAMDKNELWDSVKTHAGWESEVAANLKVKDASVYGRYTVRAGDTLSKIAQRFLDKPGRYQEIFEANKDVLKNPDLIRPGQVLNIPPK